MQVEKIYHNREPEYIAKNLPMFQPTLNSTILSPQRRTSWPLFVLVHVSIEIHEILTGDFPDHRKALAHIFSYRRVRVSLFAPLFLAFPAEESLSCLHQKRLS